MQEIKKRTIAIASVLKPVDDVRMYGKIAQSLVKLPDVQIHVYGYPSQSISNHERIVAHPSKTFRRLSIKRFFQPHTLFWKLLKLRPQSLIITTFELLPVANIIRLITGCKVYYDVQENYHHNIRYSSVFPVGIRWLLANYVRAIERSASPFIKTFLLAEKGYAGEIPFMSKKCLVLENKLNRATHSVGKKDRTDKHLRLIFSGTLSTETGVFQAIALAKELHKLDQHIQLTIIGYCSIPATYKKILGAINGLSFITLKGGETLVPHSEIIHEIEHADIGIISYPITKITANRIPTKLFEYLGLGLHIILPDHKPWEERCVPNSSITINLTKPDYTAIHHQLIARKPFDAASANIFWDDAALLSLFR